MSSDGYVKGIKMKLTVLITAEKEIKTFDGKKDFEKAIEEISSTLQKLSDKYQFDFAPVLEPVAKSQES